MAESTTRTLDVPPRSEARPEPQPDAPAQDDAVAGAGGLVDAELLVEDVSIDGMCGVY
jgi:mycofactocin precursor